MHNLPSHEQVQAAPAEDLVLMLFEGAVRFGHEAQEALATGDRGTAAILVGRVRAIVAELDRSLNPAAGSITRHLSAIYEYVLTRLEPDTIVAPTLREVIADLEVLCEAWTALVAERRHEQSPASSPALA